MIIVSQDKKKIFNSDNASLIMLCTENEIWIDTEKTSNLLGKYKTEERAKEVLREIQRAYEHMTYLQIFPNHSLEYGYKSDFIYEMPKE